MHAIADALTDDDVFLMADMAFSSNLEDNSGKTFAPTIFAFSVFHCLTVSLAYGGEGLGTAWGEQRARSMLGAARRGRREVVDGDPLNVHYIARRGVSEV